MEVQECNQGLAWTMLSPGAIKALQKNSNTSPSFRYVLEFLVKELFVMSLQLKFIVAILLLLPSSIVRRQFWDEYCTNALKVSRKQSKELKQLLLHWLDLLQSCTGNLTVDTWTFLRTLNLKNLTVVLLSWLQVLTASCIQDYMHHIHGYRFWTAFKF